MTSLSLGRYSENKSLTNKLDSRVKLFLSLLFVVLVFLPFQLRMTKLIFSLVYILIALIVMVISKISILSFMKNLKGMWFMIIFLLIVYLFIPNSTYTHAIVNITPTYALYWESVVDFSYISFRLVIMMGVMLILTTSTKPMDLTYAFEWYMTPLKLVKFPVHEISMTLSIALRFIPTLLEETDRIIKAQSSRGIDFNRGGIFKRMKAIISLIIPLFVSSIDRSEELANAMEARGYDPRAKRTRFRTLHFGLKDVLTLIIWLLIIGLFVALWILDINKPIDIIYILSGHVLGF